MSPAEGSTSWKAFVNTIITTLLSPLSLLLGFYLGHALQKPHLSIADLSKTYYAESHKLSKDLRSEISSQPLLVSKLRDALTNNALARNEQPCVDWLDGGEWEDRCTDSVLEAAHGLAGALIAEPEMPMPDLLKAMRLSQAQVKSLGDSFKHLTTELESIKSNNSTPRTGGMDFDAGILNTGDFDGVVSKYGTLKFADGSFSIYAEKFIVVKAHGFETVQFSTSDVPQAERQALEAWRRLVKNHAEVQFELQLKSGDGKPLLWKGQLSK